MTTSKSQVDPFDDWETADYSVPAPAITPRILTKPKEATSREEKPNPNAKLWSDVPYQVTSSTGSTSIAPALTQPKMQILKRPSSANSTSSASSASNIDAAKTLAEREKQYREARARIFGDKSSNASTNSINGISTVKAERSPIGPSPDGDKGFSSRIRHSKSSDGTGQIPADSENASSLSIPLPV